MVKPYGNNVAVISSKIDKNLTFSILLSISVVKQHAQKTVGGKGLLQVIASRP